MGHRHVFSSSFMLETENDQRWNLTEHPYAPIEHSSSAAGSGSLTYPPDNMLIDGAAYAPTYSSLPHNVQNPNYQHDAAGPSNLLTDPSSAVGFYGSSSNYNGPIHEDDTFDISVGNGRWQYKRKSPSTGTASSSDASIPTEPWEETPNIGFLNTHWDYPNLNSGQGPSGGLSLGSGSSVRNVRSRADLDLEVNLPRTPLSSDYHTSSRNHELNHGNPNTLMEISGHNNGLVTRTNHVSRNFQGASVQSVRGTRSNYIQRSAPTFRVPPSGFQLGHDEGLQLAADGYSSRHPRPLSTMAWRSGDRNGRARMSIERYRSFPDEASFRDQPPPEGLMIMDRSAFYGSRNPFDHHRDMRLDIDDMSYEELLALGERMGSVSTGLSEDLISKCLTESINCSSDQIQEEGNCVICLEEYANMDDVGMLKGCRHDFHVGCIKKWLSMKNLCPICKSEPIKHK